MGASSAFIRCSRRKWALSSRSTVLLWQLGMALSSVAAVVDACTGRRLVLSGFVLVAPLCVALTGSWLRTAVAGVWGIGLVVVLGVPDGIWGTRLETSLIGAAVFVAVTSTLALLITLRAVLSLAVTGLFAAGCGGHEALPGRASPTVSAAAPVSCRQQSKNWKNSPGYVEVTSVATTLKTIRADENASDYPALRAGMRKLMPAALDLARYPMPPCADPARLYGGFAEQLYQAGSKASSAKGLRGLLEASAMLRGLETIGSRLTAEVNHALATAS